MIEAIIKLVSDRLLQQKLVDNADDLVQSKYSREAVAENVSNALLRILENLG